MSWYFHTVQHFSSSSHSVRLSNWSLCVWCFYSRILCSEKYFSAPWDYIPNTIGLYCTSVVHLIEFSHSWRPSPSDTMEPPNPAILFLLSKKNNNIFFWLCIVSSSKICVGNSMLKQQQTTPHLLSLLFNKFTTFFFHLTSIVVPLVLWFGYKLYRTVLLRHIFDDVWWLSFLHTW